MHILLKALFTALLLVMVVAVGTEVVALRRNNSRGPAPTMVVVRKASSSTLPLKTVRRCSVARSYPTRIL